MGPSLGPIEKWFELGLHHALLTYLRLTVGTGKPLEFMSKDHQLVFHGREIIRGIEFMPHTHLDQKCELSKLELTK